MPNSKVLTYTHYCVKIDKQQDVLQSIGNYNHCLVITYNGV